MDGPAGAGRRRRGRPGALTWFTLNLGEFEPFLYRGGFALVALATATTIMAVVHPFTRIGSRVLGSAPLRWIGVRSYGIYLWHWPVFMVTRPELDVPFGGLPLPALRLTVTVTLADLSYRFVETPIRRGALGRAWKTLREAQGPRPPPRFRGAGKRGRRPPRQQRHLHRRAVRPDRAHPLGRGQGRLFVNVKVPRSWDEPNNEVISEGVERYSNALLVDW